jgi:hypothetical protein
MDRNQEDFNGREIGLESSGDFCLLNRIPEILKAVQGKTAKGRERAVNGRIRKVKGDQE